MARERKSQWIWYVVKTLVVHSEMAISHLWDAIEWNDFFGQLSWDLWVFGSTCTLHAYMSDDTVTQCIWLHFESTATKWWVHIKGARPCHFYSIHAADFHFSTFFSSFFHSVNCMLSMCTVSDHPKWENLSPFFLHWWWWWKKKCGKQ